MSVLTLHALRKHYGRIKAIDGIDLSLADGELFAVLGPSGSGKSTLMRLVAGLESPSSGDVLVDDSSVVGIAPRDRNVAMVFQSFALYPQRSVRDNILFPLVARKVPRSEHQTRLDKVSRMLDVADLLDRWPNRLSGGQQQRVALARALVRDPNLFVFDEPLSALDAQIRSQARAELRALHDRTRITTLYVTHDQVEAMGLADRIAVLSKGVLHQVGTPHELYREPADLFVAGFIGNPPMNLLPLDARTIAGVRPENLDVHVQPPETDFFLNMAVTIEHLEYLGSEWLAYGVVESGLPAGEGRQHVVARLPSGTEPTCSSGTQCWFAAARAGTRLFDRDSGKRKAADAGVAA